jgi:hypothetical protein
MGIGLTVLFGLLALGGAAAMAMAPTQIGKAWGFGVAMLAAALAVVVAQVYA